MRKTHQYFFVTISFPEDNYPYDAILEYARGPIYDMVHFVKESGKNANHPHLHLVLHTVHSTRTDSVTRSWKRLLGLTKCEPALKVKPAKDHVKLVYDYLCKDDNLELIYTDFDKDRIEKAIESRGEYIRGTLVGKNVITLNEAPYVILLFCQQNGLNWRDYSTVMSAMLETGYVMTNVVKNKKSVHEICDLLQGDYAGFYSWLDME